jgi:branched-chain amino acid transport system substrate-binding protein
MRLRLNKAVAVVGASALLLLAVPAIGMGEAGATKVPTYTIGYEGPLSGGNQQLGLNMVFAVQLAINWANANKTFGKLPFKLALKSYDDQGDPTVSPTQAQAAVANSKLVAIVGPAFSGATAAAEPYYSAAHVATVSPSATRVSLASSGWNNFFRVVADDGVQGPADADYLVKTKALKTLYVVNDGTAYGAGLAQAVAAQASTDGATVTTATVPGTAQCQNGTASATEYSAAATQAVASKAAGLFYGGYYCDLGLFLGALSSAGYTGTVMSGDGSLSPALIQGTTPASAANNVLLTCACASSTNTKFNAAYQALSHFSAANATYAPESFDAANTIIAAMKYLATHHKKISRSNIVSELHKISYKGMTKLVKFQSDGNIAGSAIFVNKVESGKIVQLGLE